MQVFLHDNIATPGAMLVVLVDEDCLWHSRTNRISSAVNESQ